MDQEISKNLCSQVGDIISSPELRALSPSTSHPTALQYSSFVLSIVTCIFGLPANIMVIFVTGFLMKKNKYKIWFLNLALADFIFLLFLPFYAVSVISRDSPYGHIECTIYNFLIFVNIYAGIYILTALNIDRALSVAKPVWHLRFHSKTFCWCMCALIWVISVIFSILANYVIENQENLCSLSYSDPTRFANICRLSPEENQNFNLQSDSEIVKMWEELTSTALVFVVRLAVVGYGIPLCVILVSNIIIAFHVKNSKMAASSRLYRLIISAVVSFFCTRLPCVLSTIIFLGAVSTLKITLVYKVSIALPLLFSFAATNSLLNPVVYVLEVKEVRSEFINFFRIK